jgi:pyrophosphatase PpaX
MPEPLDLSHIRAILFDVDGTLLDTFEFIYQAFEHALEDHGFPAMSRHEIARHMGGPLEECYTGLVPDCDPAVMVEAHRLFQANNIDLASLFPGTLEVLDHLKLRGLKLAAVTTRSIRSSIRSMEATGTADYFDIILSAEDVENHKPHPEPLLKALAAIGERPEHAVMIGDTYADIGAGKACGTLTIAALYGFGGPSLLESQPDIAINDVRELLGML